MEWLKRWARTLLARLRRTAPSHEAPPMNRHALRDIGLEDWFQDRTPPRDERGERITRP